MELALYFYKKHIWFTTVKNLYLINNVEDIVGFYKANIQKSL